MTTSTTIANISAKLAAYELYISRGVVDQEDARMNQLLAHKKCAEDRLNDIRAGRITVDATRRHTVTYPTVES